MPPIPVLRPEQATASLSERAYYRLRDLIVSLELAPGSLVNERELMERLELGRTPVREALRRLAQERLIDVYPRRGMFVSRVDVGDLADLSEARVVLEGAAARLAAERATPEERAVAAGLAADVERTAGEQDEGRLIELDQRIHQHVYRCAHNRFLEATLEEYYVLTLRIWLLALDRVARLEQAVQEHRELLTALLEADGDAAEATMRRHIRGFEQAIREVL